LELTHRPCPYEHCGSSDAFSWNTEKQVGSCHSCGTPYPSKLKLFDWAKDRYPTKSNTRFEVIEDEMKKEYRDHRGITDRTMRTYDVETDIDENNKEIRHGYKYPDGKIKYRIFPKQFTADTGLKTDVFWGMNKFNGGSAKAVTVCEGEIDAMSAYQMLGSKYPVVSLPSATPKRTILENCFDWLNSFEKIYLSLDTDDKAEAFAMNLMNLFPGRVYKVNHDKYKDANEFLQAGAAQAYTNAWWNAKLFTPSTILSDASDFLELYEDTPEHNYIPTGIPELDAKILGLMQGHFTVLLAETGIGKTELMRYLEYNLIKNHPDVRFATWHLEETPLRSLLGLVSYDLNDNLTRKDLVEKKGKTEVVKESIKKISDNGNYYQFTLKESDSIEALCDQIRFLSEACGCKYIFFEPIQDVLSVSDEKEKESKLASLSIQLSKMASKLNVGIVTIAHTNENGDVKYCKMVSQRASVRIVLSRDKDADSLVEKNTTYLRVTKNRPCGLEGDAGALTFDDRTFKLTPREQGF
jgi:twinkle protein